MSAHPHGLVWRRSSRSTAANNCVEAARLPDRALSVRDSKDVARRPLRFSSRAWTSFLGAVGTERLG
ncbi:DUF397 domain-containing protein [Streptomyces sp. NPDC014894]|uniref:DUF397 domain-containing protein n=1 Tax=unclassified Streptomyces TaxID=2593676 RepID=UPI0036F4D46C